MSPFFELPAENDKSETTYDEGYEVAGGKVAVG